MLPHLSKQAAFQKRRSSGLSREFFSEISLTHTHTLAYTCTELNSFNSGSAIREISDSRLVGGLVVVYYHTTL